jgi:hypothetical protein
VRVVLNAFFIGQSMKPHEITEAYEAERKEKRAALIKGILDNVGGEILNSKNFGKRATEKMIELDLEISNQFRSGELDTSEIGKVFLKLIDEHVGDELEREGLA